MGMNCVLGGMCVCVVMCVSLSLSRYVCVCQILRENKPKERNGYSRRDCAGLEVGRGRVRVSKCARWCMCCMRPCEGRTNRERWLLCSLQKNTLPWWYVFVKVGRIFCHACTSMTILWQNQDSHTYDVVEVFHDYFLTESRWLLLYLWFSIPCSPRCS